MKRRNAWVSVSLTSLISRSYANLFFKPFLEYLFLFYEFPPLGGRFFYFFYCVCVYAEHISRYARCCYHERCMPSLHAKDMGESGEVENRAYGCTGSLIATKDVQIEMLNWAVRQDGSQHIKNNIWLLYSILSVMRVVIYAIAATANNNFQMNNLMVLYPCCEFQVYEYHYTKHNINKLYQGLIWYARCIPVTYKRGLLTTSSNTESSLETFVRVFYASVLCADRRRASISPKRSTPTRLSRFVAHET